MALDPIIAPERIRQMELAGLWGTELVVERFDAIASLSPERTAVVSHAAESNEETSVSFGELKSMSDRVAVGLSEAGVKPGDVVAVQLPSWWHYLVIYIACVRLGAAINPLMPIFRERELSFMLKHARSKVLIIPRTFRGFAYPEMVASTRGNLPDLKHVFTVDGADPANSFEAVLLHKPLPADFAASDVFETGRPSANAVTELMYTSGTTGEPKGAMHTANTLLCKVRLAQELFELTNEDVVYMGSPVAHQTGFMYACIMTLSLGIKSVLQDVWNAGVAARLIEEHGCTVTVGATPFLNDLVHVPAAQEYDLASLRLFLCAGAPIPRVLLRDAAKRYPGLYVMSAWGMTENGIVTATYPGDAEDKVFETDGRALPHQQVRVVGPDGEPVTTGTEGRLQARGPTCFVGYLNRPEAYEIDEAFWFETGDNARMDADGYIRITGRSKDIIIRGGENVPVVEVENLLYQHSDIIDAAVVGIPDERLGERGCAIVTLQPEASLDLPALVQYLTDASMAKNYLPESLEIIEEFPRTPSGKIQKFKLRQAITEGPLHSLT